MQDLSNILESIKPYPKASARKEGPQRGRKKGKTEILTSNESFEVIAADQNARDEKKAAIESRKLAAAAKKFAIAEKKIVTAAKKMAATTKKEAKEKPPAQAPKRISQRRMTVATVSYAESPPDSE